MTTAQSYAHAHVRPEWLALVQEDPIEPELPIIDPHHHLWHQRVSGRYMPEQLHEDLAAGHNIVATVFLQCGWMHRTTGPEAARPAGETEAVNAAAILSATGAYGPARACAGIVGYADLRSPALDETLDAHVAAASHRFRGIRQVAASDPNILPTSAVPPPAGLMLDPAFTTGVKRLGERGFTFDSWAYHTQLADLLAVVQQAPETRIVINHVGGPLHAGPYRRDECFTAWKAGMAALAACPNTTVKLGGLGMPLNGFDYHKNPLPPTSAQVAADWKPYIDTCIELFGPARSMFESNFPVDKGMVGYTVLWNAFKHLAAGASATEKAALFHDTAASFYRL
jgi:predicted TIM-barrel fold metal-dependent hydrolase